jgi:uncharacterized protein (TIGR02145 family)
MKNLIFVLVSILVIQFGFSQDIVVDIDGYEYNTVQIGNQTWLKENLRVTKYNDGTPIPFMNQLTGVGIWDDTPEEKFTYYELNLNYERIYGKLYNGFVMDNEKNVCPVGWKVPTDADFRELVHFVDPNSNTDTLLWGVESPIASLELVTTGSIPTNDGLWTSINNSTNSTGFSVVPAGGIVPTYENAGFTDITMFCLLWSTTPAHDYEEDRYYTRYIEPTGSVWRYKTLNTVGASIRCIKDVNYDPSAQIEEIKIDYTIYPNPVVDQLNVVVDLSSIGSEYTISDMNGKILIQGIVDKQQFQIDMSEFSYGSYFIKIDKKIKKILK